MARFLHTADWQIGRMPSQFDPDDATALSEARFDAVERLAALARDQGVDAVLVAGDVFDSQTVGSKTIRRLFNAMAGFAGPWLLLPGNHDAALGESVWTRARRDGVVPPNATLCLRPEPVEIADRMVVLPAPLTQRHSYGDLTEWFVAAATPAGLPRVGLAHGAVQGILAEDIDSANPIAQDRAASARLDYLALGDWHGTKRIDDRSWYAGTPESDRFKDNGAGNALVVDIDAPGAAPRVETHRIGAFAWRSLAPTLSVASDVDAVLAALADLGRGDVVEFRPTGSCTLADRKRLGSGIDAARARIRALAVDETGLRVAPTDDDIAALRADGYVGDVLHELRRRAQAGDDETARAALLLLSDTMLALRQDEQVSR
jgi:DNA repair exonuclease SbcCD nuclease subunit